jgi:hypothetical protein
MRRSVGWYWSPVLAWTDLALKMTETSAASASVISHRTSRMAQAGLIPNARARKEFARMGSEKIAAGVLSAAALAKGAAPTHMNNGVRTFARMLESTTALMALGASQNTRQFLARQAKFMQALSRLTMSAVDLSNSTARVASRGLKPIHSRAVANAKRLNKR